MLQRCQSRPCNTNTITHMQYAFIAELRLSHFFDEILSAAHTMFFCPQYTSVLPAVVEACVAVTGDRERSQLKGAQVLEILHERSHFGAPDVGNIRHAALSPKRVLFVCK